MRIRVRTNGGTPAKDMMFERRVSQERSRAAPPIVVDAVMGFGKHKGKKVSEVDDFYLLWCQREIGDRCPLYILYELTRRGLYSKPCDSNSPPLTKKQQKRDKRMRRAMARSQRQSEQASEKNEALRSGVVVKGAEYDRLRLEFLRADGDPDACPFDTDDYTYQGPTMATVGGRTVIVSSEFTPEAER